MALHNQLPIYKQGYDLLTLAADVQQHMPRSFKASLGNKIHCECIEILMLIGRANAARGMQRAPHIVAQVGVRIRTHCHAATAGTNTGRASAGMSTTITWVTTQIIMVMCSPSAPSATPSGTARAWRRHIAFAVIRSTTRIHTLPATERVIARSALAFVIVPGRRAVPSIGRESTPNAGGLQHEEQQH